MAMRGCIAFQQHLHCYLHLAAVWLTLGVTLKPVAFLLGRLQR